jgi:hypothetical protein
MRLLWHVGFYDGPLSGLCLYEGRVHWFQIKGGALDPDEERRDFEIVALSDEQVQAEEERHALWVQHVGNHCGYDENNKRLGSTYLRPRPEWNKFYSLPPLERNYTKVVKVVSEEALRTR